MGKLRSLIEGTADLADAAGAHVELVVFVSGAPKLGQKYRIERRLFEDDATIEEQAQAIREYVLSADFEEDQALSDVVVDDNIRLKNIQEELAAVSVTVPASFLVQTMYDATSLSRRVADIVTIDNPENSLKIVELLGRYEELTRE